MISKSRFFLAHLFFVTILLVGFANVASAQRTNLSPVTDPYIKIGEVVEYTDGRGSHEPGEVEYLGRTYDDGTFSPAEGYAGDDPGFDIPYYPLNQANPSSSRYSSFWYKTTKFCLVALLGFIILNWKELRRALTHLRATCRDSYGEYCQEVGVLKLEGITGWPIFLERLLLCKTVTWSLIQSLPGIYDLSRQWDKTNGG